MEGAVNEVKLQRVASKRQKRFQSAILSAVGRFIVGIVVVQKSRKFQYCRYRPARPGTQETRCMASLAKYSQLSNYVSTTGRGGHKGLV